MLFLGIIFDWNIFIVMDLVGPGTEQELGTWMGMV